MPSNRVGRMSPWTWHSSRRILMLYSVRMHRVLQRSLELSQGLTNSLLQLHFSLSLSLRCCLVKFTSVKSSCLTAASTFNRRLCSCLLPTMWTASTWARGVYRSGDFRRPRRFSFMDRCLRSEFLRFGYSVLTSRWRSCPLLETRTWIVFISLLQSSDLCSVTHWILRLFCRMILSFVCFSKPLCYFLYEAVYGTFWDMYAVAVSNSELVSW